MKFKEKLSGDGSAFDIVTLVQVVDTQHDDGRGDLDDEIRDDEHDRTDREQQPPQDADPAVGVALHEPRNGQRRQQGKQRGENTGNASGKAGEIQHDNAGGRQKEYGIRNATMPRRTASQPTLLGLASAKAAPA